MTRTHDARVVPDGPRTEKQNPMTPEREILGITVRTAWEAWAREQPDVADHPEWLTPWGELPDRIKEVDARIGEAVLAMFKIPPVIDSKR